MPFPIEVISSGSYNSLPEIVPVDGGREKLITTIPATSSAPETFGLTIKVQGLCTLGENCDKCLIISFIFYYL